MEIGSDKDQPNFDNVPIPQIDQAEQDKLDVLLAAFRQSLAVVEADDATVSQDIASLVSWSQVAEHVLQLAGPIINQFMTRQNVPKEVHPSKLQTALPQLLGIVTAAPKDRAGLVGSLLTSLV